MRISDWSSDVCSSDLGLDQLALGPGDPLAASELTQVGAADVEHDRDLRLHEPAQEGDVADPAGGVLLRCDARLRRTTQRGHGQADLVELGRASVRDRVCQYVYISGVAGSLKKK